MGKIQSRRVVDCPSAASRVACAAVAMLLWGAVGVSHGQANARAGAVPRAPLGGPPGPGKTWLLEAQSLLADRKVGQIAVRAERNLGDLLKDPATIAAADGDLLVRLAVLREFGAMFARVGRVEGPERETLKWLLANEPLLATVMLAMSPQDSPDTALGVVSRIHSDHGDKPVAFAELTAALAVVYDSFADVSGDVTVSPDPAKASRLFAFYTNARGQMRFDPKTLPWELGVFVVDCQVSEQDLAWALGRYGGRQKLRDLVFDVRYEENAQYSPVVRGGRRVRGAGSGSGGAAGGEAGEGSVGPTLEQLARSGGNTRDMAIYGVSVCRALGVPAAVMFGAVESGDVSAWLALLEVVNGRAVFDLTAGRLDIYRQYPGQTIDPQTFEVVSEEELALLSELQGISGEDRRLSAALCKLAGAERVGGRGVRLTGEGEEGNGRRVALLLRAVQVSAANRAAWVQLREMARATQLTAGDVDGLMAVVERGIAPKYPAFALELARDLVSWRGTQEQIDALDRAKAMLQNRPDLLVRLHLYRGDLLAEAKREREALQHYGAILEHARDAGPVAAEAMDRVDRILREQKELRMLLETYKAVWTKMPAPTLAVSTQSTTYYRIGVRYADLLEETGEVTKATQVRQRLSSLVTDGDARRGVRISR